MVRLLTQQEFLTREEMIERYEELRLLVFQPDKNKYFEEGTVLAIGGDSDEDLGELLNLKDNKCPNEGYIFYAREDKGEDLHVIFR